MLKYIFHKQEGGQFQRQLFQTLDDLAPKKAPWFAPTPAAGRNGLGLSDIQRLEREKKLEQMKEQQQMMQIIAQQQQTAAALREQVMQKLLSSTWSFKLRPRSLELCTKVLYKT